MEKTAIGIDIGGTKISAAVIKEDKIISEVLTHKTPDTAEKILNTILETIEIFSSKHNVSAVGIATAGAVNLENSKVAGSTGNLPEGYNKIEFKKIIEEKYNIKTFVENDANAAAYAEYKYGAAKGHSNTITVTLGTGIGGGIIVNGALLRGKSGMAAEIGHLKVNLCKERPCTCGVWGCWEAYASGTGYAQNAREYIENLSDKGFLALKNPQNITSYDVLEGKKQNDKVCTEIHELWENYVLAGLIALANIFDPDSIVISGGLTKALDIEKIEKLLNQELVVSPVKVLHAEFENNAGMIGAAALALN